MLLFVFFACLFGACQEDEHGISVQPNEGLKVTGKSGESTRTSIGDGYSILWNSSDAIALFSDKALAETNDADRNVTNIKYTLASGENNVSATFTVADNVTYTGKYKWGASGVHRFYAYYPYREGADATAVLTRLPATLSNNQVQEAANSSAHIGVTDFMYASLSLDGGTVGTYIDQTLDFSFRHAFVLLEFTVTNSTAAPIALETVKLDGNGQTIAGDYTFDIITSTLTAGKTIDASGNMIDGVKRTVVQLSVKEPVTLAVGASTTVYMMIAPTNFTASPATITVGTTGGVQTFSGNADLLAGKRYTKTLDLTTLTPAVVDYTKGALVLMEGNMSNETGTLCHISPDGVMTPDIYYRANGEHMGNVAQDLFINDGKIYIITQNGSRNGGVGMFVVADAKTMEKVVAYEADEFTPALSWPTHIAVTGGYAFIRDNNGVYSFNLATKTIQFIEGTKGVIKNRMAVAGNKVFAAAGKSLHVLEPGRTDIVHTLTMDANISGLRKSADGKLWVSVVSNPAVMMKIDPADYSILKSNELGSYKIGAGWGAVPAFAAFGDNVYFTNGSTTIYRHDFTSGTTEQLLNITSKIADAAMNYNSLGVDPETGEVYMATIKGYGQDYKINHVSVWNFNAAEPLKATYAGYFRFPAGVYFPAEFK